MRKKGSECRASPLASPKAFRLMRIFGSLLFDVWLPHSKPSKKTIDALGKLVRQMMALGCFQSALLAPLLPGHRNHKPDLVLTLKSCITLAERPEICSTEKRCGFHRFKGTNHGKCCGEGLRKALYNYMHRYRL